MGRDVTDWSSHRSALVLAPHADDETFGCAVSIMRRREAGHEVSVVIATDGGLSHGPRALPDLVKIRADEAREAARRLGVAPQNLTFLGFPDSRLGEHLPDLRQQLASIVSDRRPDDLLVTSAVDRHPDHIALGRAVRSLALELPSECHIAEFPVWSWVVGPWFPRGERWSRAWGIIGDPASTFAGGRPELVRTAGYLKRKRDAIEAYRSQTFDLVGGVGSPALGDDFLADFLQPFEVFFPLGRRLYSVKHHGHGRSRHLGSRPHP